MKSIILTALLTAALNVQAYTDPKIAPPEDTDDCPVMLVLEAYILVAGSPVRSELNDVGFCKGSPLKAGPATIGVDEMVFHGVCIRGASIYHEGENGIYLLRQNGLIVPCGDE